MNISKELLKKAKTAKSAEELIEMAKEENIELTVEQATKALAKMNKNSELSDEELDNVAGGGCGTPPEISQERQSIAYGKGRQSGLRYGRSHLF